jgi:hypothetical protein
MYLCFIPGSDRGGVANDDDAKRLPRISNLEYSRLMLGGSSEALGSDIRVTFAPVSPGDETEFNLNFELGTSL